MSPTKPRNEIASSETDSASLPRRGSQHDITSEVTSSEIKFADDAGVLEGSREPSLQTGWGLLEKFISGDVLIDWKNLWVILRAIAFIAYVVFVGILFYRDNELGRFELGAGFLNFGIKAAVLFVLFVVVLLITTFLTLGRATKTGGKSMKK